VVPSTPFQIETPDSQASGAGPEETLRTRSREPAQLHPQVTPKRSALCWLIINDSQRHISLPVTGKLVLGRFDPGATGPLDVDLTYEDRDMLTVSRRHARIVGVDGYHTAEDLGSSNGVFVNGKQITLAHAHPLRPGDEIALGGLQMRYEKVPTKSLTTFSIETTQVRRFLFLAHTGRKVAIAPPNNYIIGRSDPAADFVPGIDLSQDGEVAARVSRRHARITWTKHGPCLKDLNSTFGTRFNGVTLHPDQAVLLKPGDHLSLGGCVLAYDIEE
jgi:pSer/pThr/pTyr-binding forkhead associated (FHA) protein